MNDLKSKIEEIKKLICNELSVKIENLSVETRLLHDLGVDGDDGSEFIKVYAGHFGVDLTDFEFTRYFGEEAGGDPITLLYFLIFKSKRPKFIPITIYDLAVSADRKRWIKPSSKAVS